MDPGKHRGRPPWAASEKSNGPATDPNQTPAYAGDGLQQAIDNAAGDWWTAGAMLAIRQLALSGRGFDADHVLNLVGQPTDPHYVGAVFSAAQRQKIIEPVGSRVARDGRLLRIWWPVVTRMDEAS